MKAVVESGRSYAFSLPNDFKRGNIKFTFHLCNGKTEERYIQHVNKKHVIITRDRKIVYSVDSKKNGNAKTE